MTDYFNNYGLGSDIADLRGLIKTETVVPIETMSQTIRNKACSFVKTGQGTQILDYGREVVIELDKTHKFS